MKNKNYALIGGGLAVLSIATYFKFAKFKKELKLGINVLKLDKEGKNTSVLIENLSHDLIPSLFTIEKIELITDTKELASNSTRNSQKSIIKNANNPLSFNVLSNTSINEIENSKIAVSFNVLGFKQRVLYQPQTVEEVTMQTPINNVIANDTINNVMAKERISNCGCS
jgi:hypothetical protein